MAENGFAHLIAERAAVPAAQVIHGEDVGGLPSHQAMITSKVEEQPGIIVPIGLYHVKRVMISWICGILIGAISLLVEISLGIVASTVARKK